MKTAGNTAAGEQHCQGCEARALGRPEEQGCTDACDSDKRYAPKRNAPPQPFLARIMTMGQSSPRTRKLQSRQLKGLPMQETTALARMRTAARGPKLAQNRARRASALAQIRAQVTGSSLSAAQHRQAAGAHSPTTQRTQQQALMQVTKCYVLMQQLRSPVTALA